MTRPVQSRVEHLEQLAVPPMLPGAAEVQAVEEAVAAARAEVETAPA